eukprot:1014410_1
MSVWLVFLAQLTVNTIHIIISASAESECNATNSLQDIKQINWETIGHDASSLPNMNISLSVSEQELTLSINAQLEYLGYSIADNSDGYGTTYTLDFKSSNAHSMSIANPGICSNRLSDSFDNTAFPLWWQYSECPSLSNQIGQTDSFLAYPLPSKFWSLSMGDGNMIVYDGNFKLNELLSCDPDGVAIQTVTSDEWLNISGTFYINLVSPLAKAFDVGYYYIYQLYSAPFVIAVRRTVNVLSSTGISLFTMTVVAVYKQEAQSSYKLIVLTESADYLFLYGNQLLSWPNTNELQFEVGKGDEQCVAIKNSICSQIFELIDEDMECANNLLSGEYMVRFNVKCNPNIDTTTTTCQHWLATHDNYIDLDTQLNWNDNVCSPETYVVRFGGEMSFYVDDTFTGSALQAENGLYTVGTDRVYVRVSLSNHPNTEDAIYDLISMQLSNLWLCTVDETQQLSLDANNGGGGCFGSALVDSDGPYHIFANDEIAQGYDDIDMRLIEDDDINDVRFSFVVPREIVRSKLYVHCQISIDVVATINGQNTTQKRLLLVSDMEFNQIRHYMESIKLQNKYVERKLNEAHWWLILVGSLLMMALIGIIVALYVIVKHYNLKDSINYSIIKSNESGDNTSTCNENDDEKDQLIWRQIIEDQLEKANSC